MFWGFGHEARGILAPQPGIEPAPPALDGEVLTTGLLGKSREVYQYNEREGKTTNAISLRWWQKMQMGIVEISPKTSIITINGLHLLTKGETEGLPWWRRG